MPGDSDLRKELGQSCTYRTHAEYSRCHSCRTVCWPPDYVSDTSAYVCLIINCSYNVLSDIDLSAIKAMEMSLSILEKRLHSGDVIYGAHLLVVTIYALD